MRDCVLFLFQKQPLQYLPGGFMQAPIGVNDTCTDSASILPGFFSGKIADYLLTFMALFFVKRHAKQNTAQTDPVQPIKKSSMSSINHFAMVRMDISIADVKIISGCSKDTAARRIQQAKDAIGKEKHQALTIREYCTYFGYDFEEVVKNLKLI